LQQVVGHPGLEDVLEDAGLVDAGDDVLAVGVARHDDPHHLGPALARLLQELDSRDAGHALVAQDDVDAVRLEQPARLVGAARVEHAELVDQRAAHRFRRARLVIDEQHRR